MPRIYTSASEPLDFCNSRNCWFSEPEMKTYYAGDEMGPDGRGDCWDYDADHPEYQDEGYNCHRCAQPLTAKDD